MVVMPYVLTSRARLLGVAALALFAAPAGGQEVTPPQETPPVAPPRPAGNSSDPSPDAFKYGSPPALQTGLTEEVIWPAATEITTTLPNVTPGHHTVRLAPDMP